MSNSNKGIIGFLVIIVLAMIVYTTLFQRDVIENFDASAEVISNLGADLVSISEDLSRANLKSQLFSDPGYVNLVDFSAIVQQQPMGRPNPFDPLGK